MPSRMLPEQSRTTAIEPVPLPNWRMISSLARTATLARAGSGGAGPIATESGTTWRLTTVRREKTWPRKKPSRSRLARLASGLARIDWKPSARLSARTIVGLVSLNPDWVWGPRADAR